MGSLLRARVESLTGKSSVEDALAVALTRGLGDVATVYEHIRAVVELALGLLVRFRLAHPFGAGEELIGTEHLYFLRWRLPRGIHCLSEMLANWKEKWRTPDPYWG